MHFSMQRETTLGLKPGLTMNFAPAAIALSTWSTVSTVPAPSNMSGTSLFIASIAFAPWAVLKVISAQGMPPEISAFASGTAFSASSIFITGIMPIFLFHPKLNAKIFPPLRLFNRTILAICIKWLVSQETN
jgi:hypothetical protein